MILPEDTKAPLPEDDEYTLPPSSPIAFVPYSAEHPDGYPYTFSPRSALTQPLLADVDDLELGPAPPYSPYTTSPPTPTDAPRTKAAKRRRKALRYCGTAIVGYLCVLGLMGLIWRGPPRRHGPPREDPGPEHEPEGDEPKWDGEVLECAKWDINGWKAFPRHPDQPKVPSGEWKSQNATFLVSTHSEEMWTRLVGAAAVGEVFMTSYDATSEAVWQADTSAIQAEAQAEAKAGKLRRGEYARVTVEPLVRVGEDEDYALAMLHASRVCLEATNVTMARRSWHPRHEPGPDEGGPGGKAMGVGIRTRRPENSSHPHNTPLQFRIHIAFPSLPVPNESAIASILGVLGTGPSPSGPEELRIKAFEVVGGATGIDVDVPGAEIGKLTLRTAVGEIRLGEIEAETLLVDTNGAIGGAVSVSRRLDLSTPVGDINLNVSLARAPPGGDFDDLPQPQWNETHPHPGPWRRSKKAKGNKHPSNPEDDEGAPVSVQVHAGTGSTVLRYVGWEEGVAGLRSQVNSVVGRVEVYGHPSFEGPIRLHTTLGDISLDAPEVSDPEDRGRERHVTISKEERLGSKTWVGEVAWQEGGSEAKRETESNIEEVERDLAEWSTEGTKMGKMAATRMGKGERGLEVQTSVGAIKVVL